jgi:hypothetical protein
MLIDICKGLLNNRSYIYLKTDLTLELRFLGPERHYFKGLQKMQQARLNLYTLVIKFVLSF